LSSNLGSNLTTNAGNLLNAGNVYGSNTSGVTNNLNNVLSSNLGQLQSAYGQYGSNLTSGSNTYAGNMVNNANTMQGAYNQYGSNLLGGSTNYANIPDMKDNTNKKVLGKMKDEMHGLLITEFIALNPKVYSLKYQTLDKFNKIQIENKKKLKGVSKTVVEKEITHDDYITILEKIKYFLKQLQV
jgi:hypothetical protein